jgi:hypothetical protein
MIECFDRVLIDKRKPYQHTYVFLIASGKYIVKLRIYVYTTLKVITIYFLLELKRCEYMKNLHIRILVCKPRVHN